MTGTINLSKSDSSKEQSMGKKVFQNKLVHFLLAGLILSALVCMYALCYYYGYTINSDNAFFVRAGEEVFSGNPLLKGWVACYPTALTTDFLWTALMRLFLSREIVMYWMGPLCYGLIVLVTFLLMKKEPKSKIDSLFRFILLSAIIFVPRVLRYGMLSVGVHCISNLYILISFLLLEINLRNPKSVWKKILYISFIAFSSVNDEWPLFFFVAPVCVILIVELFIKYSKENVTLLACTIAGGNGEKLFRFFFEKAGGISTIPYSTTFVNLHDLSDYLISSLVTMLRIFNADISDQNIFSLNTIFAIAGIMVIILIFTAFVYAFVNWTKIDTTTKSIMLGALFCIGSYTFAKVYKDPDRITDFYIGPFFFLSMIFLCRIKMNIHFSKLKYELLLLSPFLLMSVGNFPTEIFRKPLPDRHYEEIADYLAEEGVTRAYTTFWDSHSLWYYSGGQVQTAAVLGDHGQIEPNYWLTNTMWYDPMFYVDCIILSSNRQNVSDELIRQVFGEPIKYTEIGEASIYIYDTSISPLISR